MDAYVQLTGNVGGTVEFRTGKPSGVPIASFRLAHTPRIRRNGEWIDGPTTWISVTCFRALAENVAKSVHRGQPVLVAGRLRTNVWSKDGVTYERLLLEAMTVGHDLSRGTASFTRTVTESPSDDRSDPVGELLHRVATQSTDANPEADDPEAYGGSCAHPEESGDSGVGCSGSGDPGVGDLGVGDPGVGDRPGLNPWARIDEDGVVAGVG